MEINTEYLNQNYEEIWEATNKQGIPIPYLLKTNISKENPIDLKISNLNLSQEIKDKLGEAYKERRRKETTIFRENKAQKKRKELIQKYLEDELKEWLKKFPQYKNVIL